MGATFRSEDCAMNALKFAEKASLLVLKTAVSVAVGTVITFFLLYVVVAFERRLGSIRGVLRFILLAAFAGGFYLTFKLLEPRMPARKKLLVALLAIGLPLASPFAVIYTPPLEITENLFRWTSPLSSTKPYEEAVYDVYSALLREPTQRPPFIEPTPLVRIQIDATAVRGFESLANFPEWGRILLPLTEFDKEWSSAWVDYARRNKQSLQLQRKFNLSKYDLVTRAEFDDLSNGKFPWVKYVGERWIKLSAVGFNQDQTKAYLFMEDWIEGSGNAGSRYLQKRNGRWYLVKTGPIYLMGTACHNARNHNFVSFAGENEALE